MYIAFAFGYGYYFGICKFINLNTEKAISWENKLLFKKMARFKGIENMNKYIGFVSVS